MKKLRSLTSKTLRDRVRSSDFRAQCDISNIVRWSRISRRALRHHVDKMADNSLPKIAKEKKPINRRLSVKLDIAVIT